MNYFELGEKYLGVCINMGVGYFWKRKYGKFIGIWEFREGGVEGLIG